MTTKRRSTSTTLSPLSWGRRVHARRFPDVCRQAAKLGSPNESLARLIDVHGTFHVGYIDFPYGYGHSAHNAFGNCLPHHHYPVWPDAQLRGFQFGRAFARDAIVAAWAPQSQVVLATELLVAQGFRISAMAVWHKLLPSGKGASCATRGAVLPEHELLLVARRGAGLPIAAGTTRMRGVVAALRGAHSAKPGLFRAELTRLFARTHDGESVRRLELFARETVPGWTAWGDQAAPPVPAASTSVVDARGRRLGGVRSGVQRKVRAPG